MSKEGKYKCFLRLSNVKTAFDIISWDWCAANIRTYATEHVEGQQAEVIGNTLDADSLGLVKKGYADDASIVLRNILKSGDVLEKGELFVYLSGRGNDGIVLKVTMSDVEVKSVGLPFEHPSTDIDTFSLVFTNIVFEYTMFGSDGKAIDTNDVNWVDEAGA